MLRHISRNNSTIVILLWLVFRTIYLILAVILFIGLACHTGLTVLHVIAHKTFDVIRHVTLRCFVAYFYLLIFFVVVTSYLVRSTSSLFPFFDINIRRCKRPHIIENCMMYKCAPLSRVLILHWRTSNEFSGLFFHQLTDTKDNGGTRRYCIRRRGRSHHHLPSLPGAPRISTSITGTWRICASPNYIKTLPRLFLSIVTSRGADRLAIRQPVARRDRRRALIIGHWGYTE